MKRYVNKDGSSDPASTIKPPPTFLPNAPNVQQSTLNSNNQTMPVQPSEEQSQFSQPQQTLTASSQLQNRFSLKNQSKNCKIFARKSRK